MAKPPAPKSVIDALRESRGLKMVAAKTLGMTISEIDEAIDNDPEAEQLIADAQKMLFDRASLALQAALGRGDEWAIKFVLTNDPTVRLPPLKPKQELFVMAYCGVAKQNARKAAELAGYGQKHNKNALGSTGARLLTIPQVKRCIQEYLTEKKMSADEAMEEASKVARLPHTAPAPDVKNKVAALALIFRSHGLLIDRIDHTTKGQPMTFADLVRQASEPSSGNSNNS